MSIEKLKDIEEALVESLPIKLFLIQIQRHLYIILLWLVLLGVISGVIGGDLGGAYLLLEPEYLGRENFWSVFLVGSALGGFLFAYMITIYISESHWFQFIALSEHPFFIFSYNNLIIPGIFLGLYFYRFIEFHMVGVGGMNWAVFEKIMGLIMGISIFFVFSASFFFARRTITQIVERFLSKSWVKGQGKRNRRVILEKARESFNTPAKANSYIGFPFKIKEVGKLPHVGFRTIVTSLNQHHERLLLIQIVTFLIIATLGLLEEHPALQIPAGASMLLVFSLFLMISGALSFWYRRIGILIVLILFSIIFIFPQIDALSEQHQAFGLDYQTTPVAYTNKQLKDIVHPDTIAKDRLSTLRNLNTWKMHQQKEYGLSRPRAVFVTASGGGLRSAFWTLSILQHMDSICNGRIADNIRLMTGASGGMLGLAYYRELHFRRAMGDSINIQDHQYLDNISKDLLNRVFFKSFTDMFLPNLKVKYGDQLYDKESGYAFDQQLMVNIPEFQDRLLGDYTQAVQNGVVPSVVITPTILNQGRKLYISAAPISYLTRPNYVTSFYRTRSSGVEFRRMFSTHCSDSLLFATALRMNATFPFILPMITLPSSPPMEVIDAGAIDNYGTQPAVKYLFEFREWFSQNTSRVIFIQIRDNDREDPIEDLTDMGYFNRKFAPLGGGYYSMTEAKDMTSEYLLSFMNEWYSGPVEIISFEYPRERLDEPASLSWHLTQREKDNILSSIYTEHNQRGFQLLKEFYQQDLLVKGD